MALITIANLNISGGWMVYKDGVLQDTGEGLARGRSIDGQL